MMCGTAKERYMATMLMAAIMKLKDVKCAFELLEKGADPNYVLEDGTTPFHLAVGLQDEALSAHFTHLLLEFGANPNVRSSEGITPLHTAAAYGRHDNVNLLLHAGGDPDLVDYDGMTVTDHVRESGSEMCEIYLNRYKQKQQHTNTTPSSAHKTPSSAHKTPSSAHNTPSSADKTPSSVHRTPSSAQKTPSSYHQTPSSAQKTPRSYHQTPSSAQKTPSSYHQTPSSAQKTPSSYHQTPSSAQKTPSSYHQTPSSAQKTPSSYHQTPSSAQKTPSSHHKTPNSAHKTPSYAHLTPSSANKIPSSFHQTPSSAHKTPSSAHKTPRSYQQDSSSAQKTPIFIHKTPSSAQKTPIFTHKTPSSVNKTPSSVHKTPISAHKMENVAHKITGSAQITTHHAYILPSQTSVPMIPSQACRTPDEACMTPGQGHTTQNPKPVPREVQMNSNPTGFGSHTKPSQDLGEKQVNSAHIQLSAVSSPATTDNSMDHFSFYRLPDDDISQVWSLSSVLEALEPHPLTSTMNSTKQIQSVMDGYNPCLHQIDVTSPDHPAVVPWLCDDTVIHAQHTDWPHNSTQGSNSSGSFHTCPSPDNDKPESNANNGSTLKPTDTQTPCEACVSLKPVSPERMKICNNTPEYSCGDVFSFCPSTPQDNHNTLQTVDSTNDLFQFDREDLCNITGISELAPTVDDTIVSAPCGQYVDTAALECATMTSDEVSNQSNFSIFTNDDSTFYQHTPKPPPSERYATRTAQQSSNVGHITSWMDQCTLNKTNPQCSLDNSQTSKRSSRGSSVCSCSSVRTERYLYHDRDEGYSLLETRYMLLDGDFTQDLNCSVHSQNTTLINDWRDTTDLTKLDDDDGGVVIIPREVAALSNIALHMRLAALGDVPGPVTDTTRPIYMKRLVKVERDPALAGRNIASSSPGFLPEIRQAIYGSLDLSIDNIQDLETKMSEPFVNPDPTRSWREGTKKCSFTYLLLDPRVTQNLPSRAKSLDGAATFECFLRAIFYIGKGVRSRPYAHFKEAIKHTARHSDKPAGPKVSHIQDIWMANLGVVSLHIFQNVIPCEAYTREACMIEALGLSRLTNKVPGQHYGPAASWHITKRRTLGTMLLKKALKIFLSEGERQIRPHDMQT